MLPRRPKGLTYVVENEWYDEFLECQDAAIESIEQQRLESQADRDQEEDKRLAVVTARLENLVNDKKFVRLPTQKAMLAYAKIKIPEIDEWDDVSLKNVISDLAATILAKSAD
jgi:hypothetical protein